jgi:hypothetical protein
MASAPFVAALCFACRLICSEVPAVSGINPQAQVPQQAAAVTKNRTVVDMTVEELLRQYPSEFIDLEFNPNQDELGFLLRKVGERVEAFFRDFSNTSSKEQVRMERFGVNARVEASTRQNFNYLLLVHPEQGGVRIEEDRTDSKGHPVDPKRTSGYVITSGYASLCMFLHTSHHFGSRFRYLGRQTSEPRARVIAFAQKPEAGDYLASYGDRERGLKPLLFQGIIWVDSRTYQIVRMRTDLLAPETLGSLMRQSTDILFSEVRFDAITQPFWLPREVVVTLKWNGATYRNQHRYSDYKLFTVESYDKVGQPQIKK